MDGKQLNLWAAKVHQGTAPPPVPDAHPLVKGREHGLKFQAAKDAADKASRAFGDAQKQYRSRAIGDKEFLAAKAAHTAAGAAFDKAHGEAQAAAESGEWDEAKHPRDENGRFV
jgi:hypothetical protein